MRSSHVIGSVLLAGLLLRGPVVGQESPSPEPEGTYGSPKAVYDAGFEAMKKKDYKTFMKCLSPESRDRIIAEFAAAGAVIRIMANLADDAKMKDIADDLDKTLAKHGLTKEAMAKFGAAKDPKEVEKAKKTLAALVKDKPAFMGDVVKLLEKLSTGKGKPDEGELKEVKITGDKAQGKIVSKVNGKEMSQPIDFVKIGGSWHIVVPEMKATTAKVPLEK